MEGIIFSHWVNLKLALRFHAPVDRDDNVPLIKHCVVNVKIEIIDSNVSIGVLSFLMKIFLYINPQGKLTGYIFREILDEQRKKQSNVSCLLILTVSLSCEQSVAETRAAVPVINLTNHWPGNGTDKMVSKNSALYLTLFVSHTAWPHVFGLQMRLLSKRTARGRHF